MNYMEFSVYSFLISMVMASIMILLYTFLNQKMKFIVNFGSEALLFLAGICLIRMVFSVEFPDFQYRIEIPISDRSVKDYPFEELIFVCCIIMGTGTVISLYKIQSKYRILCRHLQNCVHVPNLLAEHILSKLDPKHRLQVLQTAGVRVPMVTGYLRPVIYLPNIDYSEKELEMVILHEYTHWKNKDLWVKLMINILVSVFWWNPLCNLLLKNLDETLELKCDRQISKDFNEKEKTEYLETLLHTLKNAAESDNTSSEICSSEFINIRNRKFSVDRFNYIVSEFPSRAKLLRNNLILVVVGCMVLISSYYVIIQPAFPLPYDDIWEEGVDFFYTPENSYIKKIGEKYYLFSEGQSPVEIPEKIIQKGGSEEYFQN